MGLVNFDSQKAGPFAWSVAWRPMDGELECGDRHLVQRHDRGLFCAVVDGLGHGAEASTAAELALTLLADARDVPTGDLFAQLNEPLRKTRGVVAAVTRITEEGSMAWTGVGNVDVRLWRSDRTAARPARSLVPDNGVVGVRIPEALRVREIDLDRGDVIVFATDGIERSWDRQDLAGHSPEEIVRRTMSRHSCDDDDALVLAVQWGATSP